MAKDPREYGYEGDMAISQLKSIVANAEKLMSMLKPESDLPEWAQLKITLAQDYVLTARDYMESELKEAVSPAQQAAIAIAMKKAGKKPKDQRDEVFTKGHGRGVVHSYVEPSKKHKEQDPYDRKSKSKEDDDPAGHMHPMIQMSRIAVSSDGKEPHFHHIDGSKSKINRHLARQIVSTHNSMRTTQDKDEFAKKIHANRDSLNSAIKSKVNEACWSGYTAIGMKMKNGKEVPNCVPSSEAVTTDKPPFAGPFKKIDPAKQPARSRLKTLTKKARETIAKSSTKKSK
jgi:hypothetical protein